MSALLNDSPIGTKFRTQILAELHASEQVLYVADGEIQEPHGGSDFALYIGAIIVTSERLLVAESKMMGRVGFVSVLWSDVVKTGQFNDGVVGIDKSITPRNRWPIWKIRIWEGKSWKTPLDKKRLDLLAMSIQEGVAAVKATEGAESASAYEDLKKRRGF